MSNIIRTFVLMLNKEITIIALRNGYIFEDAYYKDLKEIFEKHLELIDETDFTGKKLKINFSIKIVK